METRVFARSGGAVVVEEADHRKSNGGRVAVGHAPHVDVVYLVPSEQFLEVEESLPVLERRVLLVVVAGAQTEDGRTRYRLWLFEVGLPYNIGTGVQRHYRPRYPVL